MGNEYDFALKDNFSSGGVGQSSFLVFKHKYGGFGTKAEPSSLKKLR